MLLSGLVYKYKCGGCNATYYGKTTCHIKVRICERLGISHLTGKMVKIHKIKLTAIQEHFCNCSPSFEDLSIFTRESNYWLESIYLFMYLSIYLFIYLFDVNKFLLKAAYNKFLWILQWHYSRGSDREKTKENNTKKVTFMLYANIEQKNHRTYI